MLPPADCQLLLHQVLLRLLLLHLLLRRQLRRPPLDELVTQWRVHAGFQVQQLSAERQWLLLTRLMSQLPEEQQVQELMHGLASSQQLRQAAAAAAAPQQPARPQVMQPGPQPRPQVMRPGPQQRPWIMQPGPQPRTL